MLTILGTEYERIIIDILEDLFQIDRINIRAAKAHGISREKIHEEFMELGRTFPQRPELLRELWEEVSRHIVDSQNLVQNPEALEKFNAVLEENDYPAMHHSEDYRKNNRPAYRLVGNKLH